MQPYYVIVTERTSGSIRAGLPLSLIRSPLRKRCLVSPPFSTLIDPLCNDESALQHLYSELPKLLTKNKISSMQFKTFLKTESVPPNVFIRDDKYCHHEVDLTQSEDKLMSSFNRSNVRNRIKKSLKSPLSLTYAKTHEQLKEFYKLYGLTRRRLGLPANPMKFFDALWIHLKEANQIELLLVYHEKHLVAGAFCLKYNKRISAEALAYDRDFIKMCPNHLLFWSIMLNAKTEGIILFDFGRTPLNNESLLTFKNRWGTKKSMLPIFSYPKSHLNVSSEPSASLNLIKGGIKKIPYPLYLRLSGLYYSKMRS
ncbi:GNAT family N-acetyltransferase [Thermodesulfobacteriota bacterium]